MKPCAATSVKHNVSSTDVCCVQTLDIIGSAAFGYEFNSLTCPDHKVTTAFRAILSGTGLS